MSDITFSSSTSLGQIAADHPETVSVFLDLDLDFCCGGKDSLARACSVARLNESEVIERLTQIASQSDSSSQGWSDSSTADLIKHLVDSFHQPLRELLPTLETLSLRVEEAHGPNHGAALTTLRETVQTFKTDLLQHLEDEETQLFPVLEAGESEEISELIQGLNEDHLNAADVLEQFRQLTGSYSLPADACGTWKSLWWNLQKLESDLKRHIHLENNVLFPRFIQQ